MNNQNTIKDFAKKWADEWVRIITKPKEFFAQMPLEGGLQDPLLFALIMFCAAAVVQFIFGMMLGNVPPAFALMSIPGNILGLFVSAGLIHLFVLIFGGKNGFEATLRVAAYCQALILFNFIPLIGILVTPVWSIILLCLGLKHAQKLTTQKAAFVVLVPYLIATVLLVFLLRAAPQFQKSSSPQSQPPSENLSSPGEPQDFSFSQDQDSSFLQ